MPRRKIKRSRIKAKQPTAPVASFREKISVRQSSVAQAADYLTKLFGSIWFLLMNLVGIGFWLAWNSGLIPSLSVIDPFPYNFLITLVSLEAIGLSIIVLMSQKRAARVAEIREEVDLQVDIMVERDVQRMLGMLEEMQKQMHIRHQHASPKVRVFDLEQIEAQVVKDLDHN